ncbi:YqjF family protein [Ruania halotolerans]|uniref:YqjF family protein n=1 Tax=Ruania halotolerans TaxID=2897773 RepID=UPI001E43026A|nr:DUF2071 domain-containing protein [Ruania halotolerans]UFU06743.1 DUF2071 domain-containing protein [Ruania halotolerans]
MNAASPYRVSPRAALRQSWQDVVFLHWRVPEDEVAPLFPAGTLPDVIDGSAWVGVIGLRMRNIWFGPVPYPAFFELNVRLYSRDSDGHEGVVFRAMEATDPLFAAGSRAAVRLPYTWAGFRYARTRTHVAYATRRLAPAADGAGVRMAVRPGTPLIEPTESEQRLTARWSLHEHWYGTTLRVPIDHPPWPLHRAELEAWHDDGLLAACGLPPLPEPPESVLYASGTTVRFGIPAPVR